jgi:hypothetical protein
LIISTGEFGAGVASRRNVIQADRGQRALAYIQAGRVNDRGSRWLCVDDFTNGKEIKTTA